ncbi:MAG: aspartate/methionine/tyrosine aminotransferase [Paracoccaceae bacterium]|jgi:aspartate/methionine/tyrosine aminotransferase
MLRNPTQSCVVKSPKATMFVWAPLPAAHQDMGSLEFSKKLLVEARSQVIGFGEYGEGFVRVGLIENEQRTRQALRNIKRMMRKDGRTSNLQRPTDVLPPQIRLEYAPLFYATRTLRGR